MTCLMTRATSGESFAAAENRVAANAKFKIDLS